ncbi:putative nitrate/sulfonate/taurine/bicarbonate ABC transporter, ATP-binding protein [Desulfosarcina variabilis str. Montpellier]|uniref:ABC transporter ATP-binding protein n=1 Tax=Desulfosarcina variabilis TaxID=2300 RepID=UPI003AFA0947
MPEIELVNVSRYNCRGLNLTIRDGEYFVIVGPTGAGKTTLLNMISGVTEYNGTVLIDQVDVNAFPPFKRGVGYMFQELALFPHLSVAANIAFGLRAQGYETVVVKERISFLLKMMRIDHLSGRYPHMLSGGEKKRVALARSLAPSPSILLLDEPTSNLDQQTAEYLRVELNGLLKKLGVTTVHVTHDLREAEAVANRIAFIANGVIEQVATPSDLFFDPANTRVAEFIRMPNILECRQTRPLTSGLVETLSDELKIILPYDGKCIRKIAIPPDGISLFATRPPGPALNSFIGTVEKISRYNGIVKVKVAIGKTKLFTELPASTFKTLPFEDGMMVHGVIKTDRLRYIGS